MNELSQPAAYGTLIAPDTVRIERLLPGPVERLWKYLTDGELRSRWLASGDMVLEIGAPFDLVWRNDRLSASPGERPEGQPEESRLTCKITEVEPMKRLGFNWGETSAGTFELEPQGAQVLLRIEHRRLPDRANILGVSAGWHAHLDVLEAEMANSRAPSFWKRWQDLREDYERRLPAETNAG
jgi:uncharacterized protein YndB with AHSA1/START domain